VHHVRVMLSSGLLKHVHQFLPIRQWERLSCRNSVQQRLVDIRSNAIDLRRLSQEYMIVYTDHQHKGLTDYQSENHAYF